MAATPFFSYLSTASKALQATFGKLILGEFQRVAYVKQPVCVMSETDFEKFVASTGILGRPDAGQWVTEKADIEGIFDHGTMERKMGFNRGDLPITEKIIVAQYTEPAAHTQTPATKDSAGANELFIPGGLTSGGAKETLLPAVLITTVIVPSSQDGLVQFNNVEFSVRIPATKAAGKN